MAETKHRHKEAFALMWYGCPCGHQERFWNSRDGVTPVGGVHCPSCNGKFRSTEPVLSDLSHIAWHRDEYAPDHKPYPGQRVWRDGTKLEALNILLERFERFRAQGHEVPAHVQKSMIDEIGQEMSEFSPGWPMWERMPDKRPTTTKENES